MREKERDLLSYMKAFTRCTRHAVERKERETDAAFDVCEFCQRFSQPFTQSLGSRRGRRTAASRSVRSASVGRSGSRAPLSRATSDERDECRGHVQSTWAGVSGCSSKAKGSQTHPRLPGRSGRTAARAPDQRDRSASPHTCTPADWLSRQRRPPSSPPPPSPSSFLAHVTTRALASSPALDPLLHE